MRIASPCQSQKGDILGAVSAFHSHYPGCLRNDHNHFARPAHFIAVDDIDRHRKFRRLFAQRH
ncbi:hypothetical protein D3C80_534740 [compost metagenome]